MTATAAYPDPAMENSWVDRRLFDWGVFLVLLGGAPLAATQGWIPRDAPTKACQ